MGESSYELSSLLVVVLDGEEAQETQVRLCVTTVWDIFLEPTCNIKRFTFPLSALIGEETFDPWNTNLMPQLTSEQDSAESKTWKHQTLDVASVATGFSRSARSPVSEEVLEALRSADRKGRDVVVGLSNACCKWGCSKSEISSLCWTYFLKYTFCPATNAVL